MKLNNKIIIATGGTGGHVFPAYSLAQYLVKKKFDVKIVTDNRGFKFLENYNDIKYEIINSSTIYKNNILLSFFAIFKILFAFFNSIIFLIRFKPTIVFGMGGYSSFPVCLAAKILGIRFILYENNLYLGKANKYLLPLANKMFVAYNSLDGVIEKYRFKIVETGNIIRENILNYKKNKVELSSNTISILILGGSQAAKSFGEKLPNIFKDCVNSNIKLKIYQQCLKSQKTTLENNYNSLGIENEIFNFSHNLLNYFSRVDFTITRSGSSMLAELLNCNIPIISIPLPNSVDDHQLKNAKYFEKKGYSFLIEESKIENNLFSLIKSIHKDKGLLNQIKIKQREYSDKQVFEKINIQIKKLINE
jgi:UDP-N-acetylglucosamine--N-acetylmuramyl-(pentapeptide) pyrophosphoryl-undecaprenol N-acetylglucosamine transferase